MFMTVVLLRTGPAAVRPDQPSYSVSLFVPGNEDRAKRAVALAQAEAVIADLKELRRAGAPEDYQPLFVCEGFVPNLLQEG